MYAIISYPRTGSRFLANKYAKEYNLEIGYLHHAKSVPSKCLTYEELVSQKWILHAHWHTVHLLSNKYKEHILQNYKIVHIERNHEHIFLSSIITMATGNIDFNIDDVPQYLDLSLVDEYVKRMKPSKINMLDWRIDLCYNFDKLYNNQSKNNFEKNKKQIVNYNNLYKRYLQIND